MVKHNSDSPKIILGLAIGTAVGAGLLYYYHSARRHSTPVLNKIGRTMVEVGEMLEECDLKDCKRHIEKAVCRAPSAEDLLSNAISWASTGMNLWKTLKKGR